MSKPINTTERKPIRRTLAWRGLKIRIRHTPDYIWDGLDHLEIRKVLPQGSPLPITSTGYLSHFVDAQDLARAGGPAAYMVAWLEREAATSAWQQTEAKIRQLSLFG